MRRKVVALFAGVMLLGGCEPHLTEVGSQSNQDPAQQGPGNQDPKTDPVSCELEATPGPAAGNVLGLFATSDVQLAFVFERGLHRSTDGKTWTPIRQDGMYPNMNQDPVEVGGELFMLNDWWEQEGVLRSTDDGQTWAPVNSGLTDPRSMQRLAFDGTTLFAASSEQGTNLYRYDPSSASWTAVTGTYVYELQAVDGVLFSGSAQGLLRSVDGGQTWSPVTLTSEFPEFTRFREVASASGALWALAEYPSGLFSSMDDGASWTRVTPPAEFSEHTTPMAIVAHDGQLVASFANRVYVIDGSGGWTLLGNDQLRVSDVIWQLGSDGQRVFAGTNRNGVFRLDAPNTGWVSAGDGMAYSRAYTLSTHGSDLLATFGENQVLRSSDDGLTWTSMHEGIHPWATVGTVVKQGGRMFVGTGAEGVYVSEDDGATWADASNGLPDFIYDTTPRATVYMAGGDSAVVIATPSQGETFAPKVTRLNGRGFYRSTDGGKTWQASSLGYPANDSANGSPRYEGLNGIAAFGDTFFAASLTQGIYRSTNAGVSWAPVNVGVPKDGFGIHARFRTFAQVGSSIFAGGVYWNDGPYTTLLRSDDGGNQWTDAANGLPVKREVLALATDGNALYVSIGRSTDIEVGDGIYVSTDGGANWEPVSLLDAEALEGMAYQQLAVNGDVLVAATSGWGIHRIRVGTCE